MVLFLRRGKSLCRDMGRDIKQDLCIFLWVEALINHHKNSVQCTCDFWELKILRRCWRRRRAVPSS